jgi:hypothetical protein
MNGMTQTASGIWFPSPKPRGTLYHCNVCGASGVDQEHILSCSKQEDRIRNHVEGTKAIEGLFGHERDIEEWLEKPGNRQAVIQGRKRIYGKKGPW